MLTEMQKLSALLKQAGKLPPMAIQHAASDAFKAHAAAGPAGAVAPRPILRDPHAFAQHQSVMQNPGQYVPQGQVSSGLELDMPPRVYKRASEAQGVLDLLRSSKGTAMEELGRNTAAQYMHPRTQELRRAQSMLQKVKDPAISPALRSSAMQAAQGVLHKKLGAFIEKRSGFLHQGVHQVGKLVTNPSAIGRGATNIFNAAGGGLSGVGNVAKAYAPGAAMLGAGAAGAGMLLGGGPSQQPPGQMRTASIKTAWSITDDGHKLDAAHYNADSEAGHKKVKAHGDYAEKQPGLTGAATVADILGRFGVTATFGHGAASLKLPGFTGKGSVLDREKNRFDSRHMDYAAKKHEKGENAYNPFGGILTKSRHEEKDEADAKDKTDTEKKSFYGSPAELLAIMALPAVAGLAAGALAGGATAPAGSRLSSAAQGGTRGAAIALGSSIAVPKNLGSDVLRGAGLGGAAGAATGLLARHSAAKDTEKKSHLTPEMRKLAGMMASAGKALGTAGKVVGVAPTGIGNVAGAALGAVGGAMSAPPGKRMAGAAAGSLSGIPGVGGFVAPMVAGKALGV